MQEKGDIMKKILVVTFFFIVFLAMYLLQTNFFSWYNIAGIKPNLFIIFTLYIGLYLGKNFRNDFWNYNRTNIRFIYWEKDRLKCINALYNRDYGRNSR